MSRPDLPAGTGMSLVVLALLAVIAVVGATGGSVVGGSSPAPPSKAALSVYDGRSPSDPGGSELRVLVELPRPALAERHDLASLSAAGQRAYLRSLDAEGRALRSALGARGVQLRDPVTFGRTWDGFAATVASSDLAALSSLGVRALPVRRFYPATSEPVPVRGVPRIAIAVPADRTRIAILDTGADAAGYDALDRDADPAPGADPRAPARRETTGNALAGIAAAAGERTMTIRVAGYGPDRPEISGTTDTLIAGLERAVDPNGDGAVDDAVRVALVGVNAPYAGFGDSPEAQAVRGAGRLGTLVVAPAGDEGPARPPNGVIGSPGAARSALTAGATEAGAGAARLDVTVGGRRLAGAVALGGAPPTAALKLAGPVTSIDTGALLRGRPSLAGGVALVRAGANPVAQATAAAGAGARAVLLADPRDRPLPMVPAGRAAAPVIGVTGAAAKAALGSKAGAKVTFGRVDLPRAKGGAGAAGGGAGAGAGAAGGASVPAPFSSRGPTFDGAPKPDTLAEGAALTTAGLVTGTAVAAARLAVRAAQLARRRPADTAAELRAALAPSAAAEAGGAPPAPPVPLGPLALIRDKGQVVGVRFALGAFNRGDPLAGGSTIEPATRLDLELVDRQGAVRQTLTPPGGARDLLPAEYAYRLPAKALKGLAPGAYRFRATAGAPRRKLPRTVRSAAFTVR